MTDQTENAQSSRLDPVIGLNSLATQCFRNTADNEYIVARMCMRAFLPLQFNWSALHALEKYMKAICLYNRLNSRRAGHSLIKLLAQLDRLDFFSISSESRKFMGHLEKYGGDRYLTRSYQFQATDLLRLDRAVWEVRRYCRVLNPEYTRDPAAEKAKLDQVISEIENSNECKPERFDLPNGQLEKILFEKKHPARPHLIWMNHCFFLKRRKTVKFKPSFMFENSPSFLYPEIVEEAKKYIRWTK